MCRIGVRSRGKVRFECEKGVVGLLAGRASVAGGCFCDAKQTEGVPGQKMTAP